MNTKISTLLDNKTGEFYKKLIEDLQVRDLPHNTFLDIWNAYEKSRSKTNNQRGKMFEFAVCETLINHGVKNLYYQCVLWSMPNDKLDICGWTSEEYPIIISCKTSVRERWKQADLEGRTLKGIFPKTRSYMLMENEKESTRLQQKINNHEVLGIDRVFNARTSDFDKLVKLLCKADLVKPTAIMPRSKAQL